jgi:peptidoglycan/LPS O-acetylase OafA/YrhL
MTSLPTQTQRMHFLDSLRGIAALVVVFHHFMVFNGDILADKFSTSTMSVFHFISDLNVEAVLFFFVISGFSIGLAQRGQFLSSRAGTNNYFYKRFKRIVPIYLIGLGLAALVGLCINSLQEESYRFFNLLGNLLFLQTSAGATNYWFSPYGLNGPLWSLAYEMFFYIFFPLFSLLIFRYKIFKVKINVFILLVLCTLICIVINKYLFFIPPLAFLSFFIIWWAGFQISKEYLERIPDYTFWGMLLIMCMLLLVFQSYIPSTSIIEIIEALLIASFLYLSLFLNLHWVSGIKNTLKNIINRLFKAIGHGSYALYALHYPVFLLMNHFEIKWSYQIFFIFILIICCIFLEKKISAEKFRMFALNYMLINHKKIG